MLNALKNRMMVQPYMVKKTMTIC